MAEIPFLIQGRASQWRIATEDGRKIARCRCDKGGFCENFGRRIARRDVDDMRSAAFWNAFRAPQMAPMLKFSITPIGFVYVRGIVQQALCLPNAFRAQGIYYSATARSFRHGLSIDGITLRRSVVGIRDRLWVITDYAVLFFGGCFALYSG